MWLCHRIVGARKRARTEGCEDADAWTAHTYTAMVDAPRPHVDVHPITGQRMLHMPEDESGEGRAPVKAAPRARTEVAAAPACLPSTPAGDVQHVSGAGSGPFPRLAEWICTLAAGPIPGLPCCSDADTGGEALTRPRAARIRCWSASVCNRVYRTITYEMTGSRWCNRVGRQHRSNAVQWCVYARDRVAVQRCWDAECRSAGYTSPAVRLPDDVPSVDVFAPDSLDANIIEADDFNLPADAGSGGAVDVAAVGAGGTVTFDAAT